MKKYITILLIIVMALSFAACQETPENKIVIGKIKDIKAKNSDFFGHRLLLRPFCVHRTS